MPAAASQTVSPPSWNFGTLAIGQTSAPKSFTLTLTCRPNEEGTIPCQYPEYLNPVFTTTGDYSILTEDCPAMMVAGPPGLADQTTLSCTIVATFGPTGGGVRSGTLETGGPRATLTGFAPLPPAATAPVTKKKECKRGQPGLFGREEALQEAPLTGYFGASEEAKSAPASTHSASSASPSSRSGET